MDRGIVPKINVNKSKTPIVYLDTCVMLELLKCKNGICKNEHKKEIEKLYEILSILISQKKILCPLGNQMIEMGISSRREKARDFLYRFTNVQFREPYILEREELDLGYRAFVKGDATIDFDSDFIFEKDLYPDSQFIINVTPVYGQTKLNKMKAVKKNTVKLLNEAKEHSEIGVNFEQQLEIEFQSDYQVFNYRFIHALDSLESLSLFCDLMREIMHRNQNKLYLFSPEYISAIEKHDRFLLSYYHHELPYVWIRSVLWAHRMQRSNKIKDGDNLDTVWAAAYLPFIDYAITDNDFCNLLQGTGASKRYDVQIFSMRTISVLVELLISLFL